MEATFGNIKGFLFTVNCKCVKFIIFHISISLLYCIQVRKNIRLFFVLIQLFYHKEYQQ